MVGHEHIGMHAAAGFAGVLAQPIQIQAVIPIGKETSLAVVAALDEVKRDIRQRKAGEAGNGMTPISHFDRPSL